MKVSPKKRVPLKSPRISEYPNLSYGNPEIDTLNIGTLILGKVFMPLPKIPRRAQAAKPQVTCGQTLSVDGPCFGEPKCKDVR